MPHSGGLSAPRGLNKLYVQTLHVLGAGAAAGGQLPEGKQTPRLSLLSPQPLPRQSASWVRGFDQQNRGRSHQGLPLLLSPGRNGKWR